MSPTYHVYSWHRGNVVWRIKAFSREEAESILLVAMGCEELDDRTEYAGCECVAAKVDEEGRHG